MYTDTALGHSYLVAWREVSVYLQYSSAQLFQLSPGLGHLCDGGSTLPLQLTDVITT